MNLRDLQWEGMKHTYAVARFVLDRADAGNDSEVTGLVQACFEQVDVSPSHAPGTRTIPGEIRDFAALQRLAERWISHPDYPVEFYG